MGLELVDLVVPGVGRPVVEVLKLICTAASEMQESSELCARMHEQLVFLHDKLQAMERKRTLPKDEILRKYARLVGEYMAFLEKHKRKIWIYRIVLYKRVLTKVRDFQQDITTLMFALSMCHMDAAADERVAAAAFREQQTQFWVQQQHVIAMRLTDDGTVAKEVAHEVQQVEALNVFRYELQAQTAGLGDVSTETEAETEPSGAEGAADDTVSDVDVDPNAQVLRTALDKVMRRSSVRVASVPGWFLPPHKVEFDLQAFARGSFGTVHYGTMGFAAVVVKCLLIDTRGNESVTSRFRHEAGLWYTFRHKHVLTMYGACDVSSPPFIVCERAAHGNLFNFLGSASNRSMTFRLLLEAASGLTYLHEQRVVHGDLKCDNILVADGFVAKVADFSFSYVRTLSASKRSLENASASGAGIGSTTNTAGALRWRAPECLKGRRPTFASDVYSFGMCIVEAVSQELPWGYHVDDDTVRFLAMSGELPEQPEQVSDRVWTLVERMCSFKPTDRPSLETVMAELHELTSEQAAAVTAQVPATTTTYQSAPPPQPNVSALTLDDIAVEDQEHLSASQAEHSSVTALDSQRSVEEPPSISYEDEDSATKSTLDDLHVKQRSASELSLAASQDNQQPESTSLCIAAAEKSQAPSAEQPEPESGVSMSPSESTAMLAKAIAQDDADRVSSLLATAASLEAPVDGWDASPLVVAAATGATKVAQMLLLRGANASALTASLRLQDDVRDKGCTALHVAARFGHLSVVDVLLTAKRDLVRVLSVKKRTALFVAARFGHVAVIEALLRHGADAEVCEVDTGTTALMVATFFKQLWCVRTLLRSRKVDVHTKDKLGATALHLAARNGHASIVTELLERGARVNDQDTYLQLPLHRAIESTEIECVRVLLQHKADVNAKGYCANAALHVAALTGRADIMKELLRSGARVNEGGIIGRTPLHIAAVYGKLECVKLLLQHKANISAKDKHNDTPLSCAAESGHVAVVRVLLDARAAVDQRDIKKAKQNGHSAVVALLKQRAPSKMWLFR